MRHTTAILSLFFSILSFNAIAEVPACTGLTSAQKANFDEIISTTTAYGCCTDTIQNCLTTNPECKSAHYLYDDACKAAQRGKKDAILSAVENRKTAMDPAVAPYTIDITPEHIWGNPNSKTILTVYLCGRCPYCSKHVPSLIDELEKLQLKDKIAVNLRYFPIKSHDKSTPAALAIEAAAQMGFAWPYLLLSYNHFDEFSLNQITTWAAELGLDTQKHAELMKNKDLRDYVAASKKEGFINGVTTTPTFFINGRRIQGSFDIDMIISLIRESLDNN